MDIKDLEEYMLDELCEQEYTEHKLVDKKALKEKHRLELNEIKGLVSKKIADGYLVLHTLYKNQGKPQNIPFLEDDFFTPFADFSYVFGLLEDTEEDKNISELLGISPDSLEKTYLLTLPLFEKGHYEEASNALYLLNFLYPTGPEFVLALGHAEYHCGRIKEAATIYCQAFELTPTDPTPLNYALYCYNQLGDKEMANECMEKFKRMAQNQ